jgi:hypothetical protein
MGGEGGEAGGKVAQTMFTHMNKCMYNKNKKNRINTRPLYLKFQSPSFFFCSVGLGFELRIS